MQILISISKLVFFGHHMAWVKYGLAFNGCRDAWQWYVNIQTVLESKAKFCLQREENEEHPKGLKIILPKITFYSHIISGIIRSRNKTLDHNSCQSVSEREEEGEERCTLILGFNFIWVIGFF